MFTADDTPKADVPLVVEYKFRDSKKTWKEDGRYCAKNNRFVTKKMLILKPEMIVGWEYKE